jgi:hypothetical protein
MFSSFSLRYAIAWINAAIGIAAGALAAAYLVVHPSWLTADLASTSAIVVTISAGLAQILPPLTLTPAKREEQLLDAVTDNVLPPDLAEKHAPTVAAMNTLHEAGQVALSGLSPMAGQVPLSAQGDPPPA